MNVPIIAGVYADSKADFHSSYPINLEPQTVDSGISKGYLRAVDGLTEIAVGPGPDRGSINWNGIEYRVMGSQLVSVIGGVVTNLGTVAGSEPVAMDYSFDRLGIVGGGNLYYWDLATFSQVTDSDLGHPIDMLWIDGYFFMTDGVNLIVTELNDPYSIDPLKYGSSEEDPDPITGVMKVRGEVYAVNANTIENFQDIGGIGFPFTRNSGGLISKGATGAHAKSYFNQTFAFLGNGRNEMASVYLAGAGEADSISTTDIDRELAKLTVVQLAQVEMETKVEEDQERLLVHLPDKTMVYMRQVSEANGSPVWYFMAGGSLGDQAFPCRHFCLINQEWHGGSQDGLIAKLDKTVSTFFGEVAGWRFDTLLLYNQALGGIIKSLELIGLPGRAPFGVNPTCFLSTTQDGQTYGQERAISMGAFGERRKRVQWRPKVRFANYVGLRFRGANASIASWAALNAEIEGLSV